MPYVKSERREKIMVSKAGPGGWKKHIVVNEIKDAGELNYAITLLVKAYFENHGPNYQAINDAVGALEGAKAEFQRRVVNGYEDTKIAQNGDVY